MLLENVVTQHADGVLHNLVVRIIYESSLKPEFCIASVLDVVIGREYAERVIINTHVF
jgi:hypothetical protein